MMTRFWLASTALCATLMAAPSVHAKPDKPDEDSSSAALRRAVTVAGIVAHEERLQQIADRNGGTRASGTPGYDRSVQYVSRRLLDAGYLVTVQSFDFAFFQELAPSTLARISPNPVTYVNGTEFDTMAYSGPGDVTAQVYPIDVTVPMPADAPASTSNSGCEPGDFLPAPTGPAIALLQRGTCDFVVKANNAAAAGFDAAIIFNEGQAALGRDGLLLGNLGTPVSIPVVGTTYALGAELVGMARSGPTTVRITTSTESEIRPTANVVADTRKGRNDRVVVVGAHLDSVVEGPGINDNGSGTSTILEIALQMSRLKMKPENKVRFAFWGAEESGLLGSEHYVSSLTPAQLARLDLNLNFDMVGSPNFVRFVYDGDGSDTPETGAGPAGSDLIERVFTNYFQRRNLATEPTAFDGRSDYGPFIENGIPAGGLFTGAEGIKTEEEAAIYGGIPGIAYDPCYHQACDDIDNLSLRALDQMSDAAAHATYVFAMREAPVGARATTTAAKALSASTAAGWLYKGDLLKR